MVNPIEQAFPRYVDEVERDQRCVPTTPPSTQSLDSVAPGRGFCDLRLALTHLRLFSPSPLLLD